MATLLNRGKLDRDLAEIRDAMLRMGARVGRMTEKVVTALMTHDLALAGEVRAEEKEIDALRYEIEEKCIETLAMQAPLAGDLRSIISATHIAVELERMADYNNGIAKIIIRTGDASPVAWMPDFRSMQIQVCAMLRAAQDAYLKRDLAALHAVLDMDDAVDARYKEIQRQLFDVMAARPGSVARAHSLLWCAHNLERMGDRVTNVCERAVFTLSGALHEPKPPKKNAKTPDR